MLAIVLIASGLALGALAFRLRDSGTAFAERAERVDLRTVEVEEGVVVTMTGEQRTYKPLFEVAAGPHRGTRVRGERTEGPLHTVGQVYPGWYDPASGEAHTEPSRSRGNGTAWLTGGLGFALLWAGIAALF